jgi:ABC-type transporter Mla MlaB component
MPDTTPRNEPGRAEALESWVLRGSVDITCVGELLAEARQHFDRGAPVVEANCHELTRLDAAALQVLLALERALQATERRLTLHDVPPAVAELLRRVGASALVSPLSPPPKLPP